MLQQNRTFQTEVDIFLKTAGGGRSDHTRRSYQSALVHFAAFLEETRGWTADSLIANLSPDAMLEYPSWLAQRKYSRGKNATPVLLSEGSRALYLVAVVCFLDFLIKRKRLPLFDFTDFELVREGFGRAASVKSQPRSRKIPTLDVVAGLVAEARKPLELDNTMAPNRRRRLTLIWQRNLAIILALKSSGMRVGELVNLKRGDLDFDHQGAWVTGKGRKTRFVAFDQEAWEAIHIYLEARQDETLKIKLAGLPLFCRHDRLWPLEGRLPLTTRSVQNLVEDLGKRSGIIQEFNLTPHSLRHFFADNLLRFTKNLALVQESLGHSDPKTTRAYTEIKTEEIVGAVRGMARKGGVALSDLIMARDSFRVIWADFKEAGFTVLDDGDIALAHSRWGNINGGDTVEEIAVYFNKTMRIINDFLDEAIGQIPETTYEVVAIKELLPEMRG